MKAVVIGVAFGAAFMPCVAAAEGLSSNGSTSSRGSLFKSQSALLDGRLSSQYQASTKLAPQAQPLIGETIKRFSGSYRGQYLSTARAAAGRHGIPEDLFLRLVQQESGWRVDAVSHKGAMGLAQLMPGTAKRLGVNPRDPNQNLEGGARYLRMMYDRFGSWRLALAAYNAGPGAVSKHGGVPPYKETRNYVRVILGS